MLLTGIDRKTRVVSSSKKTDYEYAISKFALLTPAQRNTVAQFLEFIINYAEQYVDTRSIQALHLRRI
jgi:hypothetical protein